jgi:hypothetical protein
MFEVLTPAGMRCRSTQMPTFNSLMGASVGIGYDLFAAFTFMLGGGSAVRSHDPSDWQTIRWIMHPLRFR